jgi:DNA polymerase V
MKPIFALVDCNNFFVSCERIFRPDLEGKPVVVLSSGDGIVVARSNEAKEAGVPMGAPVFKYRQLFQQRGVVQFSANFDLYGDISRRITQVLATITPRLEVYSVDESFLDLSQLDIRDYAAWGQKVRQAILSWIGVPVSIGIAPSKTLAKLASDRAKKDPAMQGALACFPPDTTVHLQATPIADVWGVGWRGAPKLRAEGLNTAQDLAQLRPQHAQQLMGIRGRQLVAELNGTSCHPLELEHQPPKSIARTRTFGEDTNQLPVLESAIATFAARAAFTLRRSNQLTYRAALFATTNRHKPGYRTWTREVVYQTPTADTGQLITSLLQLLREVYQPGQRYHRAGIWLSDFAPASQLQTDLLGSVDMSAHADAAARLAAVDQLNERYGKRTIRYAVQDLADLWQPQQHLRSPRYTTHLEELPIIHIK